MADYVFTSDRIKAEQERIKAEEAAREERLERAAAAAAAAAAASASRSQPSISTSYRKFTELPELAELTPPTPRTTKRSKTLYLAQVLWSWSPTFKDDMELTAGHMLNVTEEINDEWLRGYNPLTDESGVFPRNYVGAIGADRGVYEEKISFREEIRR